MEVFLQKLWEEGKNWDHEMTSDQSKEWTKLCSNLDGITDIAVSKYVGNENCWLLGIPDGSKDVYTTRVYLRTGNSSNISTHLLCSKTKLAPRKNSISLPQLELLAVLIGIRCMKFLAKEINLMIEKKIIWTDLQRVLNWVKTNKPLSIFIKNRIDEIRSEPDIIFKYISTNDNPADIPTRGESVTDLKSRVLWWKGPEWITSGAENWLTWNIPEVAKEILEKIQSEEKRPKVLYEISALAQERPNKEQPNVKEDITPFNISEVECSSLKKLLCITAYARRFIDKVQKKTNVSGNLTFKELMDAEVM